MFSDAGFDMESKSSSFPRSYRTQVGNSNISLPLSNFVLDRAAADPLLVRIEIHLKRNAPVAQLYEDAIKYEGAVLASSGALINFSGKKTGRSPKDKRIVYEETSKDDIWVRSLARDSSRNFSSFFVVGNCQHQNGRGESSTTTLTTILDDADACRTAHLRDQPRTSYRLPQHPRERLRFRRIRRCQSPSHL